MPAPPLIDQAKLNLLPGDSKNTVDKLTDNAAAVGTNIKETAEHEYNKSDADKAGAKLQSVGDNIAGTAQHYADKSGATDAANKAGDAGQNVKETVEHEANKLDQSAPGQKTYLEQAQDVAANALNTASKAASGKLSTQCPVHTANRHRPRQLHLRCYQPGEEVIVLRSRSHPTLDAYPYFDYNQDIIAWL
jgi:hypothetical protein